jgi:hypothetical protein
MSYTIPLPHTPSGVTVTRVSIDSRDRNTESKNVLDTKIHNLGTNPLTFTMGTNDTTMTVTHPSHGFQVNNNIILQGAQSSSVQLTNGITFFKGSTYARINHQLHGINFNTTNVINIDIQGFIGNNNGNTDFNNIPINRINGLHKVYATSSASEIINDDYYYIDMGNIIANFGGDYTLSSIKVTGKDINGINLNLINANYPIDVVQLNGYHTIVAVSANTYDIKIKTITDVNVGASGGSNIWVAKVISFNEGYEFNNNYKIPLQRTFTNVSRIDLVSTEIPSTENMIRSAPEVKKNNKLYWKLESDGDTIYDVTLDDGNYTVELVMNELKRKIELVERDALRIINKNISGYEYNTTNLVTVTFDAQTNKFEISFFTSVFIPRALLYSDASNYEDGIARFIVNHPLHRLEVGSVINIINAEETNSVPRDVVNGAYAIEKVIDENSYQIKLPRYNINPGSTEATRGGSAMGINFPVKSQILFNYPDTIGAIVGFRDTGKSNAITDFKFINSNKDDYPNGVSTDMVNKINLNGDNYIFMVNPLVNDSLTTGKITHVMAKLLLSDEPGNVIYNKYIQMGGVFKQKIQTLYEWEVRFLDPNGELFEFGNLDHSYTIDIYEDFRD